MNRYIIAVIWKTYDQLWNPKSLKSEIWKTYDQLWNPKSLKSPKFGKLVINCGIQNL